MKIPNSIDELPNSEPRFIGTEVERVEDPHLVTGRTEFIDNMVMPGMLHCAILRSPHAHARIVSIDTAAAEALPGVVAVLARDDVLRWANPMTTIPEGWAGHCLATERVRFVGEPVACVVAETAQQAADAAEQIDIGYDDLTPVTDLRAAVGHACLWAPDADAKEHQKRGRLPWCRMICFAAFRAKKPSRLRRAGRRSPPSSRRSRVPVMPRRRVI